MSQQLERERTFLAKELPQEIKTTEPTRIVDIYIPDTPAHSHLRLRQNGKHMKSPRRPPLQQVMRPSTLSKPSL